MKKAVEQFAIEFGEFSLNKPLDKEVVVIALAHQGPTWTFVCEHPQGQIIKESFPDLSRLSMCVFYDNLMDMLHKLENRADCENFVIKAYLQDRSLIHWRMDALTNQKYWDEIDEIDQAY